MTKRRMIHDCLWQSEGFAALSYRQRCLWIGLITTADDQGRGRAHPGLVRAAVFPFDIIAQDEIEQDIQAIVDADMLLIYQADGKQFYQVINWWEYQSPQWVGKSEHPAPDGWLDRLHYHGKGHRIVAQNWPGTSDTLPDDKGDFKADKSADFKADSSALPLGKGREEVKEEVKEEEEKDGAPVFTNFLETWSTLFPDKPQPKATTASLRKKLGARLKTPAFRDGWPDVMRRASRSTFCNDGGWFTAQWIVANDNNWRKVLDGNYDDHGSNGAPIPTAVPMTNYQDPDDFFAEGNR